MKRGEGVGGRERRMEVWWGQGLDEMCIVRTGRSVNICQVVKVEGGDSSKMMAHHSFPTPNS